MVPDRIELLGVAGKPSSASLHVKYRSCPGQGKPYAPFHGPGGRARRTTVVGVPTAAEEPRLQLSSYSPGRPLSFFNTATIG